MNFSYAPKIGEIITIGWQTNILNLGIYVIAMVIYAVIIYKFYRMLAKKEMFKIKIDKPDHDILKILASIWEFVLFILHSIVVFPIVTSLWFIVLGGFLMFLSKSSDVGQILLITMTLIASSRITSYFNEDLAKDLAKLIPFALLGIFIVDPTYFSLSATFDKFMSLPNFLPALLQYFITVIMMEFLLALGSKVFSKTEDE